MLSTPHLFSALMAESTSADALAEKVCGPNLEYAPPFLDFMASAQGKQEQQLGNAVIPAQAPEWRVVLKSGMALAEQTRDLRIAVILTHAATEIHGLCGLADGLALVLNWLSIHWETLHPTLEIEGERDPLIRTNALSYLYAPNGCMKAVRCACLVTSPVGELSVGDIENLLKGRPLADNAVINTPEQLARLVADEYERNSTTYAALCRATALQQELTALWKAKLDAQYWPDFDSLQKLLEQLSELVAHSHTGDAVVAPTLSASPIIEAAPSVQSTLLPKVLHNRSDAFHTLALARQYFEHHEPSHPAPLLIRRIEKLENMDFADIISELTPDAFGQLKQLTGELLSA